VQLAGVESRAPARHAIDKKRDFYGINRRGHSRLSGENGEHKRDKNTPGAQQSAAATIRC
jgi:hypothetical protein